MIQTEDYSPEASFPDFSEKLLWRSRVFSTVLRLVRTKNVQQVRETFLQGFKKQTSTYTAGQHGLGTREGRLIIKGGPALASQEEEHLIFILNMDNLYFWSMCASL